MSPHFSFALCRGELRSPAVPPVGATCGRPYLSLSEIIAKANTKPKPSAAGSVRSGGALLPRHKRGRKSSSGCKCAFFVPLAQKMRVQRTASFCRKPRRGDNLTCGAGAIPRPRRFLALFSYAVGLIHEAHRAIHPFRQTGKGLVGLGGHHRCLKAQNKLVQIPLHGIR